MKITKYLIGGLAALALVGCKDKMRELNTNPNTIGETDPRYMFLSGAQNLDYQSRATSEAATMTDAIQMQYFVYYTGASSGAYCNETTNSYTTLGQIGHYYSSLYGVGYNMVLLQNYIKNNITDPVQRSRYQDLSALAGIVKVYQAFRVFQNYGAAVYNEAFKAITEGITRPKYDLFTNEMYEQLDNELAGYIAVLEAPANENTVELGIYDPIYGYTVNAGMGVPAPLGNYEKQRTSWKKFANSYRLYMAWIMKAANPTRFSTVLAATKASGWFESASEGAYSYQNGPSYNSTPYNSDGSSQISMNYSVTDNFVSFLKSKNDPRLPLLARANGLYESNNGMKWMKNYFPDSLQIHWVYDKENKTWSQKSWGNVLDFEADPMMAYQGQSPNPDNYDKSNPGMFWGQREFTFRFYHPNYKPGDTDGNKTLGPWKVVNKGVVSEKFPAEYTIYKSDTAFTIALASRPQGRYYISCGGRSFGDGTTNAGNGLDGPTDNWGNIYFRRPLYTYPEFCFMMSYLTLNGESTGQTASEWYDNGLKEALIELKDDAKRYEIQVANNTAETYTNNIGNTYVVNPKVVGVNNLGLYDMTGKIDDYVTAQSLNNATDKVEAIVGQMWIYAYNQPIKMWDWWRITDYPKIVSVATPADRPQNLYWVAPYTTEDQDLLELPRRGNLPGVEAANNDNWNAIRDELLKQPGYGSTYNQSTGRIYWDKTQN